MYYVSRSARVVSTLLPFKFDSETYSKFQHHKTIKSPSRKSFSRLLLEIHTVERIVAVMGKKKIITPPGVKKAFSSSQFSSSSSSDLPPNYKQGIKRPYFSSAPSSKDLTDSQSTRSDYYIAFFLFILSFYIRISGINKPNAIIFDEIHIVRHINDYLNGTFFLDITPPLSKLFYAFVSRVLGYKGDALHLSTPGQSFQGTEFPYTGLRATSTLLGAATVPLAYFTFRSSGVRTFIAAFGALLVSLENSFIISSRLFMADSVTLFLLALSVFAFKKFQVSSPFTKDWARYMVLVGIALGLSISTKWIGFATVGWVGIITLQQLWYLFGDIEVSNGKLTRHVISRVFLFLVSPIVIYLGTFAIHILLLTQSTPDSSLLTTHFQRSMSGNDIYDLPKYITYGSTVTLRHSESLGGYLHSHSYPYKSGSQNQQVSVFDYKDFNNEWIVEPASSINENDKRLKGDTVIRLRHKNTGALLRVDNFKPPISEQEYDFEVSCFGNQTYQGNDTDVFLLKVEDESLAREYVISSDTQFKLWNKKKRCTVISHDLKLPDWGFGQQEVLCIESPTVSRSLFTFETVKYPSDVDFEQNPELLEKVPYVKLSFWSKFLELNSKMARVFLSIKPANNNASSDALNWPFLISGLKYFATKTVAIYFIGNPIIWWLSMMLIPSYIFVRFVDLFRVDNNENSIRYKTHTLSFLLGWAFHFIPYVLNEGEFFPSYYTPSLYFGILIIGSTFEYIYFKNSKLGNILLSITLLFAYYFYSTLTPITFGTPWNVESCQQSKLLDTWDYNCQIYKQ